MDKEKYFLQIIYELASKCRVKLPHAMKDNRLNLAGVFKARDINTKKIVWVLKYNVRVIKKLKKWELIHIVLHELGHIKTQGHKSDTISEYKAEKFALKAIKKYYPQYTERVLQYLARFIGDKRKHYREAYEKLLAENLPGCKSVKDKLIIIRNISKKF